MPEPSSLSTSNQILNALPRDEHERLLPFLESVKLTHGQIISRPHEPITHVYFPNHAMISVVSNLAQGQSVEIGVVGREGMSGIDVLMGVDSTPNESMVQLPDGALRMQTAVIREEFKRGGALQDLLMRYTRTLLIQVSQSAVCNRLHSVVERLSRWLLMSQDRAESDDLPLTQEFIAMMLGTRRSGVTEAAIALQGDGYIRYWRGHITILDRPGLEDFTCECYAIIKAEFDMLKP